MSSKVAKTAIVTGASSGIGRASALALARDGWNVVITARRKEALEEVAELVSKQQAGSCLVVAGDVTSEEFVKELFSKAVSTYGSHHGIGRINTVFNNAGVPNPHVTLEELPLADFQRLLNVNVVGPFLCTREAFKVFKQQSPSGGRIINNGSLAAYVSRPNATAYTTSKHAISGLTKSSALDGRAHNITVTQIDIGESFYARNALTEMAAGSASGTLQPDGRIIPEATFDVEHVANAVVHIANFPNDVTVLNYTIMAAKAPFVGRG